MAQSEKTIGSYVEKIAELQAEIGYLHQLLNEAGIEYTCNNHFLSDKNDLKQRTMLANQGTRIIPEVITKQHVKFFYSLFKGRQDVYSKRAKKPNPDTGKTGYFTQCCNIWKHGLCPKCFDKKYKCSKCENHQYQELTGKVLMDHLVGSKADGSDVIGLYPTFPNGSCNFLVFDFDNHDDGILEDDGANIGEEWINEVNAVREICRNNDIPVIVERSRSGKGAHIWLFFKESIPAYLAREFGSAILTKGAKTIELKHFKYYDRMIPAQDYLPVNSKTGKKGLGNLIALPLQGQALKNGNSAFIDEDWNAYPNQWQLLRDVVKIEKSFIELKIKEWGNGDVLGALSNEFQNDFEKKDDSGVKNSVKPWEKNQFILHREDIAGTLEIVLSDKVYIGVENVKTETRDTFRRMAAFRNPEFYKKMRMGFSTKDIPRIVYCGYDDSGYICLPRGIREGLEEKLIEAGIAYKIEDLRKNGSPVRVEFSGKLYEEQQKSAEVMLQYENGILGATTAFGKTVVGAYMIAERKVNTLILVHNTEILHNWVEDLEKFLEINEEPPEYQTATGRIKRRKNVIGRLYAGHNSLTGIIDVAMFSSLGKKDSINSIVEDYGMVIMDECHHGAAQTVEDVISSVKAKYVYGLTATPKRDDGMEKKVYMQFGPVRFRYTAKERAEKQGVDHFVFPRFTRLVSTEDLHINDAYKAVVKSEIRNNQIICDVEDCINNGRTPIVLTKYKEHAGILFELLQDKADHVILMQGGGSKKEKDQRREEMKAVDANESVILVAIDKYIGEGFNYPRLDTMMLAMPIAWEGNVEQFAGRLHRDYQAKKDVIIYDYVDAHIRVLEQMYHKRMRAYKKIGYEICKNLTTKKQQVNAIFDSDTYLAVYNQDLFEAKEEIIISSPGLNQSKVGAFLELIRKGQEKGVKIIVVTLDPSGYPEDRIDATNGLVLEMRKYGINVHLKEFMHEHFAIIDHTVVWYGSMNLLSRSKEDDNLIRVENKEVAHELKEMIFGKTLEEHIDCVLNDRK